MPADNSPPVVFWSPEARILVPWDALPIPHKPEMIKLCHLVTAGPGIGRYAQ